MGDCEASSTNSVVVYAVRLPPAMFNCRRVFTLRLRSVGDALPLQATSMLPPKQSAKQRSASIAHWKSEAEVASTVACCLTHFPPCG